MSKKYKIVFWQDKNGYSEAQDYIMGLKNKSIKSKYARIKLNKIMEYMKMLEAYGTELKEPYIKHIDCEIFELRPLKDRFFFFFKQERKTYILYLTTL